VVLLRRGRKGGAPELDAHWDDDASTGADAGAGRARGTKNGRFAALREFGGSSEYREWIRGRATGDCVVSMVLVGRYIGHWMVWAISYLCGCDEIGGVVE
jgi:hypothetical protein